MSRPHSAIQTMMGWEDVHLFCFRLLGRHHGSACPTLANIRRADFQLRPGERFTYSDNLSVPWDHEIRVEALGPASPRGCCPRCTGGRHPCPPEWSAGPSALAEAVSALLGSHYAADLGLLVEVI